MPKTYNIKEVQNKMAGQILILEDILANYREEFYALKTKNESMLLYIMEKRVEMIKELKKLDSSLTDQEIEETPELTPFSVPIFGLTDAIKRHHEINAALNSVHRNDQSKAMI